MQTPQLVQQQLRLVLALAMVAGYVDGYGLLAFNTYLSFMSGNTTQTGANLGRADLPLAIPSALAIAAFLLGIFLGNLRSTTNRHDLAKQHDWIALAAVAAMLTLACIGLYLHFLAALPSIALIAFAMGLMNTTFSRVGNEQVNLTFVTGALNKIGTHLAQATRHDPLTDSAGPWDTHKSRALLLTAVWSAFLIGAVLAGFATPRFAEWTLLPPAAILLAAAGSSLQKQSR